MGIENGIGKLVAGIGGIGLGLGMLGVPFVAQAIALEAGAGAKQNSPTLNQVRFRCQVVDGEYTVVYSPESEPNEQYPWAKPTELGGGWTPERRCNEISRRLESYRPDGLVELTTGLENGYDTVCVTTERVAGCRIVLTVPPGQDPVATRDRVFENIVVADSGQSTDAVATFGGDGDDLLGQIGNILGFPGGNTPSRNRGPIDLRPFLDAADGGTGEQLNGPRSNPGRLNPDRFR